MILNPEGTGIYNVEERIKKDTNDARDLVSSDFEEAARLLRSQHTSGLQRSKRAVRDDDQLMECFRKANVTIQNQAKVSAEKTNGCIQNIDARTDAILNQVRENLQKNFAKNYDRFNQDEIKLRQCSVRIDPACQKAQVRLINQSLSNLAADTENQVRTAQSTATQHMIALSTCRSSQDRSHYELRALARDLMDNCISNTPNIPSPVTGTTE